MPPSEVYFSEDGKNRHLLDLCKVNKSIYIALITPNFTNENSILEATDASRRGMKMFAFVMQGTKIPDALRKLKWTEMTLCSSDKEMAEKSGELAKKFMKKK